MAHYTLQQVSGVRGEINGQRRNTLQPIFLEVALSSFPSHSTGLSLLWLSLKLTLPSPLHITPPPSSLPFSRHSVPCHLSLILAPPSLSITVLPPLQFPAACSGPSLLCLYPSLPHKHDGQKGPGPPPSEAVLGDASHSLGIALRQAWRH